MDHIVFAKFSFREANRLKKPNDMKKAAQGR